MPSPARWMIWSKSCSRSGWSSAWTTGSAVVFTPSVESSIPEITSQQSAVSSTASPFAGPWELIFMPCAHLVVASLCYVVGRRSPVAGAALFATVIAAAVSLLLSVLLRVRFVFLFPGLLASEMTLLLLGVPAMQAVRRALGPVRRRWVRE